MMKQAENLLQWYGKNDSINKDITAKKNKVNGYFNKMIIHQTNKFTYKESYN